MVNISEATKKKYRDQGTWMCPGIPKGMGPWEFSDDYMDHFHIDRLKYTFAEHYGIKPLLCVVRTRADGVEYFKQIDPFALCSAGSDFVDRAESGVRVRQFPSHEIDKINAWLEWKLDNGTYDPHLLWDFVRVADEHDPLWGPTPFVDQR